MVELDEVQILTIKSKMTSKLYKFDKLINEHTNFTTNNLILIVNVSFVIKLSKITNNMVLKN